MATADNGLRSIDGDPHARQQFPNDPNLDNFAQNWPYYRQRVVLFLGAGASVGARNESNVPFPSAYHLRDGLWNTFVAHGDQRALLAAKSLALEHAAALVERSAGRKALLEYLISAFSASSPLWQHTVLPFLKPAALFTTNYDQLIEQGWRMHGSNQEIPSIQSYFRDEEPDSGHSTPMYKPHGTVQRAYQRVLEGGLVITQFDYIQVLNDRRKSLKRVLESLADACVVFIGYSFQDLDVAAVLHELRNRSQSRHIPWYAVFPRYDENVRGLYNEQYGIRQINRTFLDFMADLDDMLNFIPDEWKHEKFSKTRAIGLTGRTGLEVQGTA